MYFFLNLRSNKKFFFITHLEECPPFAPIESYLWIHSIVWVHRKLDTHVSVNWQHPCMAGSCIDCRGAPMILLLLLHHLSSLHGIFISIPLNLCAQYLQRVYPYQEVYFPETFSVQSLFFGNEMTASHFEECDLSLTIVALHSTTQSQETLRIGCPHS